MLCLCRFGQITERQGRDLYVSLTKLGLKIVPWSSKGAVALVSKISSLASKRGAFASMKMMQHDHPLAKALGSARRVIYTLSVRTLVSLRSAGALPVASLDATTVQHMLLDIQHACKDEASATSRA